MTNQSELQREIDSLDAAIDSMKAEHERELKPLTKSRSEKNKQLMDMIALTHGVKRGQKRKFSIQLETILRTPYRDFSERDINLYRAGFWVDEIYFSGTYQVGILTADKSGGTGGIALEVISACELIAE